MAAGAGFLTSTALGIGSQTPTRTVTVNVATGPTGPTGPQGPTGPAGPPGAETCPVGYDFGVVVFNSEGEHTTIATCVLR